MVTGYGYGDSTAQKKGKKERDRKGERENQRMIDIHTHLLPGLDDGSSSLEESIWLGKALAEQGVTLVAATPHFNAAQQRPSQFLEYRDQAETVPVEQMAPGVSSIFGRCGGTLF